MKSKYFTTIILTLYTFIFFSQENRWNKPFENDDFFIESKIDEIINSDSDTLRFISFGFTNKKNHELKKNINFKIHYSEGCYGCDGENEETKRNIILKGNESIFGDPINKINPNLYFIIYNSKYKSQWHFKTYDIELLD